MSKGESLEDKITGRSFDERFDSLLVEAANDDRFKPHNSLIQIGLDDYDRANLADHLEIEFGIVFPDDFIDQIQKGDVSVVALKEETENMSARRPQRRSPAATVKNDKLTM